MSYLVANNQKKIKEQLQNKFNAFIKKSIYESEPQFLLSSYLKT